MTNCQRPDRDAPGIVCGHPLPCPYHTVIIEVSGEVPDDDDYDDDDWDDDEDGWDDDDDD